MESETPLAAPSSANGVAGSARPARPVSDEKFGGPIEDSGSHMTCMGLSPVKGLFALAGQLICDCCLGFADSSLFGAGKAVLRPVACDQVPGARGGGQGTETLA